MADAGDGNSKSGQRAFQLDLPEGTWSLAGGWTEPDALGFRILYANGNRYSIRIPISGEPPIAGEAEITEGWEQ